MGRFRLRLMLSTLGAMLVLFGCMTVPKVTDPSGVDVSVTQMSVSDIKTHYGIGIPGDLNPFIPAGGLLHRPTKDFIVLQISVASVRNAEISLVRAIARDSQGAAVAELYSWRRFNDLLKIDYFSGQEYRQVYNRARNAYFYPTPVKVKPGRWSYVVVLVGKHPIPLPVTVTVDLHVDNGRPRTFNVQVMKVD